VRRLIVGATRNWSRNVLLWNLAADPRNQPHTDNGGCGTCQGAITIDGSNVSRNVAYYAVAHASKFVRPGSVRIGSNNPDTLPNVAFKTPDGKKVLIVVNAAQSPQTFNIRYRGNLVGTTLNAGSVGTYIW
jgi:glucosylceramidase